MPYKASGLRPRPFVRCLDKSGSEDRLGALDECSPWIGHGSGLTTKQTDKEKVSHINWRHSCVSGISMPSRHISETEQENGKGWLGTRHSAPVRSIASVEGLGLSPCLCVSSHAVHGPWSGLDQECED